MSKSPVAQDTAKITNDLTRSLLSLLKTGAGAGVGGGGRRESKSPRDHRAGSLEISAGRSQEDPNSLPGDPSSPGGRGKPQGNAVRTPHTRPQEQRSTEASPCPASDLGGLGRGLRMCISHRVRSDAETDAGQGTTL